MTCSRACVRSLANPPDFLARLAAPLFENDMPLFTVLRLSSLGVMFCLVEGRPGGVAKDLGE